ASPEELVSQVVDQWAELYASRYAVAVGDVDQSPKVDVMLDVVTTLDDYGNVAKALQSLTPVVSVGPSRVRGERLTVQVAFTGELDQLREYIALDPRFVVQEPQEPEPRDTVQADGPRETQAETGQDSAPAAAEPATETGEESMFAYQPLPEGDEQDAEQA